MFPESCCRNPCLLASSFFKKLWMASQQVCLCGSPVQGVRSDGSWSRHHGWTRPLHPLQGLAFLFLAMFGLLHFGVLLPSLPDHSLWKLAAGLANGLIFGLHIVLLLICMTLNPGDPNVRLSAGSEPNNTFDRSKRPHVILDQYCCICQVKVGLKSKHCSACNKCISNFDHHCKWLNNCIGGRNYRLFLCCVTSALLGCLVILLTSVVLVAAYFHQYSWLNRPFPMRIFENTTRISEYPMNSSSLWTNYNHYPHRDATLHHSEGQVFWVFLPVAGSLWLTVVVLTAILSFLACALLTHLLAFHAYLVCQGLSTYEYIVQKRDQSPSQQQPGFVNSHSGSSGGRLLKKGLLCPLQKWRRFKKANQVLPIANRDHKPEDVELAASQTFPNSATSQGTPAQPGNFPEGTDIAAAGSESLEQRAGDIYLGSPMRRARNLLPPIAQPPTVVASPRGRKQQAFHQGNSAAEEDAIVPHETYLSVDNEPFPAIITENEYTVSQPTSPEPHLLAPPGQDARSSLRHLSVSTQSLNSICDHEDNSPDLLDESISASDDQPVTRLSGSLTNLLLIDVPQPEIDDGEDDFTVHEVHITQSPYRHVQQEQLFKSRFVSLQDVSRNDSSEVCSPDPNFAGELSCVTTVAATRRRPSVDVLFIPLDSHNRAEVLVMHESESKAGLFTPRRTSFLSERSQQQQVLV